MTKLAGYFGTLLLALALSLPGTYALAQTMTGSDQPGGDHARHEQSDRPQAGGKHEKPGRQHDERGPDQTDGPPEEFAPVQAETAVEAETGDPESVTDYADIMDDVNEIIDAMNDRPAEPAAAPQPPEPLSKESAAPAQIVPAPLAEGFAAPATKTRAADRRKVEPSPVVVELFTSQGCAACPPAEALLADLAGLNDVIALAWHVDYWDYLGWRDDFARPEFSARQEAYNAPHRTRTLFTPQFFIGGEVAINDPRPASLMAAIDRERREPPHITITRSADGPRNAIELTPISPLPGPIIVQLVRYLPKRVDTVRGGDNAGRSLSQHNIVVGHDILARWNGRQPLRLTVTLGAGKAEDLPADTRHVLLIQYVKGRNPSEILAAVPLD